MTQQLLGRLAVKAKQIKPGEAFATQVEAGQLIQIISVSGKQVSDFVAFAANDVDEHLSTAVTRVKNNSLMIQSGMKIFSNRRNELFELVEDTVGRHDMLFAMCDPRRYADDFGLTDHASCKAGLLEALEPFGVSGDQIPDPINWFMHVGIVGRGEMEIRESLAEANDYVMLKASADAVIGVTACPQDQNDTNGGAPTDILVRVFA